MAPSTGGGTNISWLLLVSSSWLCSGRVSKNRTIKIGIGPQRKQSDINFPVQIGENIISPFTISQKLLVNRAAFQLIVKTREAQEVIFRSFGGVVARGSGFHQERPVTRLCQQ